MASRSRWRPLTAGHCADDQKRLFPARHRVGKKRVGRLVRPVFFARIEAQERPPLLGDMVADGAAQHRKLMLERVEHRPLSGAALDVDGHFIGDPRQRTQMRGKQHANHGSVCTSTESTGGRSRTMAVQLSPLSADAYTCPPLVPKYTPQESSASTAI